MSGGWSPQQEAAMKAVSEWLAVEDGQQIFRLFGYAGTGKTTLAKEIAENIKSDDGKKDVLYAAYTGKAALVLRSKGCRGASTIHSLIYSVDEEAEGSDPKFVLNPNSDLYGAKLLIVDECSMVGAELAHDLLSFGVKILVLGDPAQLPPVKDAGFFTNATPDVMLTEVHRQAQDNPIIRLSMMVREGKPLPVGDHGACKIMRVPELTPELFLGADQILCGKNDTRTSLNRRVRKLKKYQRDTPLIGEKLVCLRNVRQKHLFNGGLWTVAKVGKENPAAVRMMLEPEDAGDVKRKVSVKCHPFFFCGRENEVAFETLKTYEQFTYGYALTVHKSQGSQWKNVLLFDQSGVFGNDRARWLYTGITRASEQLVVLQ